MREGESEDGTIPSSVCDAACCTCTQCLVLKWCVSRPGDTTTTRDLAWFFESVHDWTKVVTPDRLDAERREPEFQMVKFLLSVGNRVALDYFYRYPGLYDNILLTVDWHAQRFGRSCRMTMSEKCVTRFDWTQTHHPHGASLDSRDAAMKLTGGIETGAWEAGAGKTDANLRVAFSQ
eukprot:2743575-Rhodomonas_salina.1